MIFGKKVQFVFASAVAASLNHSVTAFTPSSICERTRCRSCYDINPAVSNFMSTTPEDCGCQETIFSGKPSEIARGSNPREAIRQSSIFSVDGEEVTIDDLIGVPSEDQISIVIFLRSLG